MATRPTDPKQPVSPPYHPRTKPSTSPASLPPLSSSSSSSSSSSPKPKAVAMMAPPAVPEDDEDLLCCICREYPPKEVLQCAEGHLFCKLCFDEMIQRKAQCAVCRCSIEPRTANRSRIAEKKILELVALCKYVPQGCVERLNRGTVVDHETKYCNYRPGKCDGSQWGCTWSGYIIDQPDHEEKCLFFKLLPTLKKFSITLDQRMKGLEEKVNGKMEILDRKYDRCTDMVAKLDPRAVDSVFSREFDFCLKSNQPFGHIQTFTAYEHIWELSLVPKFDLLGIRTEAHPINWNQLDRFKRLSRHPHDNCAMYTPEQYRRVEMTHARFLDEPCWLAAPQMRWFIKENGDLRVYLKMRRHKK